jgi:hypothetical protein
MNNTYNRLLDLVTEAGAKRLARVEVAKLKKSKGTAEDVRNAENGVLTARQRLKGSPKSNTGTARGLEISTRPDHAFNLRAKRQRNNP